ncbi:hypothetical protein [Bartonella sp. TT29SHDZB]
MTMVHLMLSFLGGKLRREPLGGRLGGRLGGQLGGGGALRGFS